MIVGGFSFCVPTLQFRPADSAFPTPNSLFKPTLSSFFFTLLHQSESHLLPFQSVAHFCDKTLGVSPRAFPEFFNSLFDSFRKSSRINTYRRTPRFIGFWPKSSVRKSFRFRTC